MMRTRRSKWFGKGGRRGRGGVEIGRRRSASDLKGNYIDRELQNGQSYQIAIIFEFLLFDVS